MFLSFGFKPDGPVYTDLAAELSLGLVGGLSLLALVHLAQSARYQRQQADHQPLDRGVLPLFCVGTFCAIVLCSSMPWLFALAQWARAWRVKYALGALLVANNLFWLAYGASLLVHRWEKTEPWWHRISALAYGLLMLVPILFSANDFPTFDIHSAYGKLYIFHFLMVLYLIASAFRNWNRPLPPDSGVADFYKKSKLITKYMWPKGAHAVKLRIFFCLSTIAAGRVINIFVPLYSKWIAMGGFLNTLKSMVWLAVQQYTTMSIEADVYQHLLHLPYAWHVKRRSGEVLKIIGRGTASIDNFLSYLLFNIAPTIVDIVVAIFFFVSVFDIYFGVLVTVTMVAYLVSTILLTTWRVRFRREMNLADNAQSAVALDSLLNYETVKFFCNEELEQKRYKDAIVKYQQCEKKSVYSLQLLNGVQNSILGLAILLGSLLIAYQISRPDSTLSAGDYVLFTTYLLQLSVPLNFFGTVYNVIQRSFTDMENMFALMNEPTEGTPDRQTFAVEHFGALRLDNVHFAYAPERPILQDVSFAVPEGRTVALVGSSGSGKSTVIRLLYRFYEVGQGSVSMGGMDVRMLELRDLRRCMGIVPQDCVLFNDTIEYNIRYGRPDATFEEVEDAAKAAQIHDFIMRHPDGYNCVVGERGLKLSGGEKQRVAIARTILKRPHFIFLDEATSSLDSSTERQIQSALNQLCQGRTSVVVAHRLSTVVNADKIVVLEQGRVVEEGTHQELLAKRGRFAQMWELQQAGELGSAAPSTSDFTVQNPKEPEEEKRIEDQPECPAGPSSAQQ